MGQNFYQTSSKPYLPASLLFSLFKSIYFQIFSVKAFLLEIFTLYKKRGRFIIRHTINGQTIKLDEYIGKKGSLPDKTFLYEDDFNSYFERYKTNKKNDDEQIRS